MTDMSADESDSDIYDDQVKPDPIPMRTPPEGIDADAWRSWVADVLQDLVSASAQTHAAVRVLAEKDKWHRSRLDALEEHLGCKVDKETIQLLQTVVYGGCGIILTAFIVILTAKVGWSAEPPVVPAMQYPTPLPKTEEPKP